MRIWPASADEVPRVAALLCAFRDHMGRDWPSDAVFLATVRRLIERDDTEYLLAADGDGPPAGVCQIRFRWGVWWDAEDCWLEDLYVAPDARGSGLGRALVEAVIERATARGCRRVDLDVNDGNAPARRLYESLGFAPGELLLRRRL